MGAAHAIEDRHGVVHAYDDVVDLPEPHTP
jgi:hypothetical protein